MVAGIPRAPSAHEILLPLPHVAAHLSAHLALHAGEILLAVPHLLLPIPTRNAKFWNATYSE